MIVSIVNEKGGSGKTTLAVNLAVKLSTEGDDVLLVDADPQRNTQVFLDIRVNADLPLLFNSVVKLGDGLSREIKSLSNKYDSIVIDTGGRDSKEMRQALVISDIVIIPSLPSQYDVSVLDKMISLCDEVSMINSNLKAFIVINRASPNPFLEKKIRDLKEYINEKNLNNLKLMESILYEREAYKNAVTSGVGITEFENKSDKAKNDFNAFYDELIDSVSN